MQKDISDKTKKILEYKRKNEELSGKYESINEAFDEAKNEIENINNKYKEVKYINNIQIIMYNKNNNIN